MPHDL
jgi:hypothetical protein